MSPYPSPYQPPTFDYYRYAYPPRAGGAAKRAGWLMIALGILGLLFAGCMGLAGSVVDQMMSQAQLPQQDLQTLRDMEAQIGMKLSSYVVIAAAVTGAGALLELLLGLVVLRGSKGATIISIVFSFVVALLLLLNVVVAALQSVQGRAVAQGACGGLVIIGLMIWQLIWLFQANSASGQSAAAMAYYQQQYQAYQQQYQQYAQQAAGGWQPIPPPPGGYPAPPQGAPPQVPQPPQPPSAAISNPAYDAAYGKNQELPPPPPPGNEPNPPQPPPSGQA